MNVYTEYQRQLWDPACKGVIPATHGGNAMEEWHFQHRGGLGMFMVDMRGNRISADGRMIKTEELREPHTLMSEKQKKALEAAFATPGVSCMFVCSEIPFVSGSPEKVRKLSKKIKFLEGHCKFIVYFLYYVFAYMF